jgi:hypothetical protein
MFQKELYIGIPNVTVWQLLQKRLCLKVYTVKLFLKHHALPEHCLFTASLSLTFATTR